jgi:peroxiredoxin
MEGTMQKTLLAGALTVAMIILGCAGDPEPTPEETNLVTIGQLAPSFELHTLSGVTFNLEAQRGKVVLVNFFATWCPPCREELPHLDKEIWQRFNRDRFSLVVIGREEDAEVLQPFMDQHGYDFPVAGDPEMVAYSQYASRFIPRNYVIGPDGTVLFQSQGFERHEFDEMVSVIAAAVEAIEVPEALADTSETETA